MRSGVSEKEFFQILGVTFIEASQKLTFKTYLVISNTLKTFSAIITKFDIKNNLVRLSL